VNHGAHPRRVYVVTAVVAPFASDSTSDVGVAV
jgi:hypothetical protein